MRSIAAGQASGQLCQGTTHPLQDHVKWDLEEHDSSEHELVAGVDVVLRDPDVRRKAARESRRHVHAVQLEDEQAKEEQREHRQVAPGVSRLGEALTCAVST